MVLVWLPYMRAAEKAGTNPVGRIEAWLLVRVRCLAAGGKRAGTKSLAGGTSEVDDANLVALGGKRDLALAKPHGIIAERLATPAAKGGHVTLAGRDLVQFGG